MNEAHERDCASCRAFAGRYRALDARLGEALRFDVDALNQAAESAGEHAGTKEAPSGSSSRRS